MFPRPASSSTPGDFYVLPGLVDTHVHINARAQRLPFTIESTGGARTNHSPYIRPNTAITVLSRFFFQ
jgi:imidazolonepropionase-like amidohydrolase